MGSKNRLSKYILPLMLKDRGSRPWVEPFVGGANIIDKVEGVRIGGDTHKYLIALLKAVQEGWVPPTDVSREVYHHVKKYKEIYHPAYVGFVGFLCTFGGKWFGGGMHLISVVRIMRLKDLGHWLSKHQI